MPTMKDNDVRLELRVPRDLYEALAGAAAREERSLNRQANLLLRQALGCAPAPPALRARRPRPGRTPPQPA